MGHMKRAPEAYAAAVVQMGVAAHSVLREALHCSRLAALR